MDHAQLVAGLRIPNHHPMVDIRIGRFCCGADRHRNGKLPGDESRADEPGEDAEERMKEGERRKVRGKWTVRLTKFSKLRKSLVTKQIVYGN